MDKKKVERLVISARNRLIDVVLSKHKQEELTKINEELNEALDELEKSDWISVEDELPPIGDVVQVRSKQNQNVLVLACRTDESTMKIVYPLNKFYSQDITHWKNIDK